jgi:hypothetical protein
MVVWRYFQFWILRRQVWIVDPVAKALFSCLDFFADGCVDSPKIAKTRSWKMAPAPKIAKTRSWKMAPAPKIAKTRSWK